MKILILGVLAVLLVGCGKTVVRTASNCTMESQDAGTLLTCDDDRTFIPDQHVLKIHDPCGDEAGHVDEVVLEFTKGIYVAWFRNVGLVTLMTGVTYKTTDHQKCIFKLEDLF